MAKQTKKEFSSVPDPWPSETEDVRMMAGLRRRFVLLVGFLVCVHILMYQMTLRYRPSEAAIVQIIGTSLLAALGGGLVWRCVIRWLHERAAEVTGRSQAVIANAADGILVLDAFGRIVDANRAACDIFGATPNQFRQMQFADIMPSARFDDSNLRLVDTPSNPGIDFRLARELTARRLDGLSVPVGLTVGLFTQGTDRRFVAIVRDLSEFRKREEKLRMFESALVHANDAVFIMQPHQSDNEPHGIIWVNQAFEKQLGCSAADVIGKPPEFLRSAEGTSDPLKTSRLSRLVQVELPIRRKDGTKIWVEVTIVPVKDRKGRTTHWVGIQRDTTERRRQQIILAEQAGRLQLLVEKAPVLLLMFERDGTLRLCNGAILGRLGSRDYVGASIFELLGTGSQIEAAVRQALQGSPAEFTEAVGGRELQIAFRPVVEPNGTVERILGVAIDVTERLTYQRDMEHRYRLARLTGSIGFALTNEATLSVLLQTATEIIVQHLEAVGVHILLRDNLRSEMKVHAEAGMCRRFHEGDILHRLWNALIGRVIAERKPLTVNIRELPSLAEIEREWLLDHDITGFAGYPLILDGQLIGVVNLFTRRPIDSITHESLIVIADALALGIERKNAEEALKRAKIAAEAANQAKSEFLANISHEVRTPMSAIIGYTDIVLNPHVDLHAQQRALSAIRAAGRHLLQVVNDILDLSKIEAGKLELEAIETSPLRLAREVLQSYQSVALEKGLSLRLRTLSAVPRMLILDPTRLRQILFNLVGNAVKFTPSGQVDIEFRLDDAPANEPTALRITVRDSGIGISPERLQTLFEPFRQGDSTTTRRFGGTGLGLSICRRLATHLGGRIEVQSELRKGSTFTLVLPVPAAARRDTIDCEEGGIPVDPPKSPLPLCQPLGKQLSGRVLLAEDGRDNVIIVSWYLRCAGLTVEIAEDGRTALALALQRPFDLILLDVQMPELDGYEVARTLRARGCRVPILALTAHAMAGDRERCLAAGCTEYLSKPVEREELLACIESLLPTSTSASRTARFAEPVPRAAVSSAARRSVSVRGFAPAYRAALLADLRGILIKQRGGLLRIDRQWLEGRIRAAGLYGLSETAESLRRLREAEAEIPREAVETLLASSALHREGADSDSFEADPGSFEKRHLQSDILRVLPDGADESCKATTK